MSAETTQRIYAIIVFVIAGIITLRYVKQSRFVTFIITFWILGAAIIHQQQFDLPLKVLGGNLQIQQLIFLLLTGYFLITLVLGFIRAKTIVHFPFEKYLYLLVLWFLIVIGYHWLNGILTFRDFRGYAEGILIILVIYLILKRCSNVSTIETIWRSLIIVAVISSIVAIIQFFINTDFLRVGAWRGAFGGKLRSNGLYTSEYMNCFFTIIALIVTLLWVKSKSMRATLIPLLIIGILLSFHRMSWIVTAFIFLTYFVLVRGHNIWRLFIVGGILIFSMYVLADEIFPSLGRTEDSSLVNSRLRADTMSDRFKFYTMVINNIDKVLIWGAGTKKSSIYYYGMLSTGVVGEDWALGERGGIHNGYLEILFFHGLPLLLIYIVMLISIFSTFKKMFIKSNHIFMIPLLFLIVFIMMNLTNSLSLHTEFGCLFGIILGCSAGVVQQTSLNAT